jgi:hypothetical protein
MIGDTTMNPRDAARSGWLSLAALSGVLFFPVAYLASRNFELARASLLVDVGSIVCIVVLLWRRRWKAASAVSVALGIAVLTIQWDLSALDARLRLEGAQFRQAGERSLQIAEAHCPVAVGGDGDRVDGPCRVQEWLSDEDRRLAPEVWVFRGNGEPSVRFLVRPGSRRFVEYESAELSETSCRRIEERVYMCGF